MAIPFLFLDPIRSAGQKSYFLSDAALSNYTVRTQSLARGDLRFCKFLAGIMGIHMQIRSVNEIYRMQEDN